MRRVFVLLGLTVYLWAPGSASAGPGSASGPITVDSTTFVPGSSVMGTDGGVYGDNIAPVTSTTTAAFRMTRYRAEHVNLRDNSGAELGTVGNPINITGQTAVTITSVTVNNSSFSVTGSTVTINTPGGANLPVSVNNTVTVTGTVTTTPGVTPVPVTAKIDGSSNTVKITGNVSVQPVAGSTFTVTGSTVNILGTVPVSGTFWQATQPISGTVGVSNSSFSVSGSTINVNVNGTVPVSGTFWQADQPVYVTNPTTSSITGLVNVTGSTVSINGTITAVPSGTQNVYLINPTTSTVSGTVSVTGSTVGVNGVVSVSGSTVSVTGSTVSISGTPNVAVTNTPNVNITNSPTVSITGNPTVTVANSSFSVTGSTVAANIIGTVPVVFSGTNTVTFNGVAQPVSISGTPSVNAIQSGTWLNTIQVLNPSATPTSVGYSGGATQLPAALSDGVLIASMTQVAGKNGLNVNIIGGAGAGGTSSNYTAAFPTAGNAAGYVGPTGLMQAAAVDSSSDVYVNVANAELNVTGSTVTVNGTVSISTSTPFNVTGSTVGANIIGTVPVNVSNTPNVSVTNTPNVSVTNTVGTTLTAQLPTGTNNIGTVTGSTVSISGSIAATIAGTINTYQTNPSTVTFNGVSQPVTATISGTPSVYLATTSVSINGSSNTVTANQGGSWTNTVTQTTPASLQASVSINGSSNTVAATESGTWNVNAYVTNPTTATVSGTVAATQSGTWNVNATPVGTSTVTFNGVGQPVTQSGSWTDTVTQATPANLQASVSINGSSNTVAATQSGSWTNTVTQGTNSNLRASVAIDGSSNTVSATQSGTWTNTVNQGTNRWNVNFSTTTTVAVLSSTGVTTNVAISTPIAGVSSQTVRIFRLMITVDAATTITFRDGSTNFGDSQYLAANGSIVLDLTNEPWYITSSSNGFVIKQSGTANIGARIWYTQS